MFSVTSPYSSYITVTLCLRLLSSGFAHVFPHYLVSGTSYGRGLVNKEYLFASSYPSCVAIFHITVSLRTCFLAGFLRGFCITVILLSLFCRLGPVCYMPSSPEAGGLVSPADLARF